MRSFFLLALTLTFFQCNDPVNSQSLDDAKDEIRDLLNRSSGHGLWVNIFPESIQVAYDSRVFWALSDLQNDDTLLIQRTKMEFSTSLEALKGALPSDGVTGSDWEGFKHHRIRVVSEKLAFRDILDFEMDPGQTKTEDHLSGQNVTGARISIIGRYGRIQAGIKSQDSTLVPELKRLLKKIHR